MLALGSGAGKNLPLGGWLGGWTSESLVLPLVLLLETNSTYEKNGEMPGCDDVLFVRLMRCRIQVGYLENGWSRSFQYTAKCSELGTTVLVAYSSVVIRSFNNSHSTCKAQGCRCAGQRPRNAPIAAYPRTLDLLKISSMPTSNGSRNGVWVHAPKGFEATPY